ncbi:EXT2 [Lepeophtheirus salmonis]|uniref:EXT2 n=1 Tax=Lepeophtheirus salmonis TaxID=72036 RepID=A0A7R8CNX6_LEPSM|nr:EXT2 [Lepeophtheirus salmonis]CAF2876328.1 EXT2 [Lepeophtheirus salmonis]
MRLLALLENISDVNVEAINLGFPQNDGSDQDSDNSEDDDGDINSFGRKKQMSKEVRGKVEVASTKGLLVQKWKGNNDVILVSNFGASKLSSTKRYSRSLKKYIDIPQPKSLNEYNKHISPPADAPGYSDDRKTLYLLIEDYSKGFQQSSGIEGKYN